MARGSRRDPSRAGRGPAPAAAGDPVAYARGFGAQRVVPIGGGAIASAILDAEMGGDAPGDGELNSIAFRKRDQRRGIGLMRVRNRRARSVSGT